MSNYYQLKSMNVRKKDRLSMGLRHKKTGFKIKKLKLRGSTQDETLHRTHGFDNQSSNSLAIIINPFLRFLIDF